MIELDIQAIRPSVLEDTFNNIGQGFQEILDALDKANANGQTLTVQDTLALQQSVFHYTMFQETVTKIASKSANAINEVAKAQ
ncbi:TPA: EscI/YscI/HrpB family type III secretion system inner rod protein [Vibrio metschnikovii]|uniref:EscI/YscI/HrpB family type III secretion system inner rod protein n=1 Tax=Vibrio TaxID=662 RepID=UPI000933A85D|nr:MULTISPECIES: EscI/YscI/HrpB family type III secretion system inner rod protein [Vibrio]EGQ7639667.1 EscI/YscI/HrpB family type III secretion system inner rod protein [Vibrio cholerae]EGQ9206899.1 EscI/YscI/HrpB family type III secretion system inner rod protein [Vibrio cholerae]EGQ9334025.1 EscI/YscI/HrpB family type III secretion system inner rod protein [Vibrio cholerae]EHE6925659.1 EscI/YscI/HrpB family type III secretion system inner rod protein [Vibrio cholerae]EHE6949013.1 EscI/YscI/